MTDLLLVNPSAKLENYGPLTPFSAIEPPLWAALIAAYIRQHDYSVEILDAEAEGMDALQTAEAIHSRQPRLCAIVVLGINPSVSSTPKMTAVRKLVSLLKHDVWMVLTGLHPSALPEKTLQETGVFVAQGEGFQTILGLLRADLQGDLDDVPGLWWREGIIKDTIKCGPPAPLVDVDDLPMAAWDLLPMEKYRCHNWQALGDPERRSPYAMVYTSLGCCFTCSYCNIHAMYGGKPGIRYRNPLKVAAEIDYLVRTHDVHIFKFMDEMFALKKGHVMETCEAIAALGHDLNIWAYARADTLTPDMAQAMRRAGIRWLCFGFESASEAVRLGVAKRYHQEEIARVVALCRWAGINIIANFLVGLPDDDLETMQETLDMAKRFNFEYFNLYACAAYPGSPLYEEAVAKGLRLPREWEDWSQFSPNFLPMPTKHLTAGQVLEFRDRAFREYFSRAEYLAMVREKFGEVAVRHIEEMLKVKVVRHAPRD